MARRKRTGVRKTPAGTWSIDYRDSAGVKRRKTFPLQEEAVEFYERVRVKIRDGEYILPAAWTVAQGAATLLEKKANKRAQTVAQLRSQIEKYIKPALGHMVMTKVTFEDIERAGEEWRKTLSAVTVNKIYGAISAIYKAMRRNGVKNNPMLDVERHEKPAAESREEGETGRLREIRAEPGIPWKNSSCPGREPPEPRPSHTTRPHNPIIPAGRARPASSG